ncbi:hypothetical protein [Stenotrophomonas sepilia]
MLDSEPDHYGTDSNMAKNPAQSTSTKTASFEFSAGDVAETSTLNDLVHQLDAELQKVNGEAISMRSLKRTLDFLQASIGISIDDKHEQVPLSTLRTVRLLFLLSQQSSRNVFRLLAPPDTNASATMEFSTATTIPCDSESSEIIQRLIQALEPSIDPTLVQLFSRLTGGPEDHSPTENILLLVEHTNDEVRHSLRDGQCEGEASLRVAFDHLAKLLEHRRFKKAQEWVTPANEALYVYLKTLAFRHFVQHHTHHLAKTRIRMTIGNIREDAIRLCRLTVDGPQQIRNPTDRLFSVNNFHHIALGWPDSICALIHKATGIATTTRQLKSHVVRAKVLLASYAFRSFDCTDPDATVLTVYDVVAALSSFRYQQEVGDEYKPYWHGQTDQGKNPQRLFDKGLDAKNPHQHQGVMHIYLNRFYEYQASFEGNTESHRAWMRYQSAILSSYQSAFELNDIVSSILALKAIDLLAIMEAKDLAISNLVKSQ